MRVRRAGAVLAIVAGGLFVVTGALVVVVVVTGPEPAGASAGRFYFGQLFLAIASAVVSGGLSVWLGVESLRGGARKENLLATWLLLFTVPTAMLNAGIWVPAVLLSVASAVAFWWSLGPPAGTGPAAK